MRIGDREIGSGHPPYIIAEIGVNHDGSPRRAVELTRLAAGAGADAVKFQLFEADLLMSRAAKLAAYQKAAGETDPVAMLRRLELTIDELSPCVRVAHRLGVHAIVSVFSVELVRLAEGAGWDAYKTASPDIVNKPLLDALAGTGRPLIVSTGASTLGEVRRAVRWLDPARDRVALLQCVSAYPTPRGSAALGGIGALRRVFAGPVGYSDHTTGESAGAAAVRAGACILERHFTDDRDGAGPDHGASLEPDGFARYVASARRARAGGRARGTKRVLGIERDVRRASRQSLVAARDLRPGRRVARGDLTIKRPGTGIPPFLLEAVIGRRVTRHVPADTPLRAADLGPIR